MLKIYSYSNFLRQFRMIVVIYIYIFSIITYRSIFAKMGGFLRQEVLHIFKKLHRTRLKKFAGDEYALQVVRDKINVEFKKFKNVTNQAAIIELNKFAQEVEQELRTSVIQAVETSPGRMELQLTSDVLVDNIPYKNQREKPCSEKKKSQTKSDCSPATTKDTKG